MIRRAQQGNESRIYRFDLTCSKKRFFKTEQEALEAADFRMLENMSADIGVYQCPTCMLWHLTSIKPASRKA